MIISLNDRQKVNDDRCSLNAINIVFLQMRKDLRKDLAAIKIIQW